jgi:hypothetical protein
LNQLFYVTGNGVAADLLFSYQNFEATGMLQEMLSPLRCVVIFPCSVPLSLMDMQRVFSSAEIGNVSQLAPLMRGIAASCAGLSIPWDTQPLFESINLAKYRKNLGKVLLMCFGNFGTILHFAIYARSTIRYRVIVAEVQEL